MRYSYINALDTLTKWAIKEGYKDISFDHHSEAELNLSELNEPHSIKIGYKFSYEEQTYLFLHEAGHHQIRKDWDKFKNKLSVSAIAEEKKSNKYKRRTSYIVSSLGEEYFAWEEGLKLAKKLGIKINQSKWTKLKTHCLMRYIRLYGSHQY